MNTVIGLTPTKITGFNGLYNRGNIDTCPVDHLVDCVNCIFPGKSQIAEREPFTVQNDIATRTIISFCIANVSGGAALLTLNSNGDFYDETHANFLINAAGADDFTYINIFGRTYISFKENGKAFPGGATGIYYLEPFTGTYVLTSAAGVGPNLALHVTLAQVNPGVVDIGNHNIAVSFLYDTGYLSPPSSITTINSTGGQDIEVTGIMTSASGRVVGRVLLMTLANQEELFFVPGGTINDNVTTVFTINTTDTGLIASADYLNDVMPNLPSCSSFSFYKGRLVLIGQDTAPDDILISDVGVPDSFNTSIGVIHFPVDYGINTSNGSMVIRDVLYVTKPNGTYSTQDNGNTPDTWSVTIIDSGIGAWANGISAFSSSMSGQDVLDSCLVCSQRGLMLFDGTYGDMPLTYKIETVWQLITGSTFQQVQIAHDVFKKRIYISVPLHIMFALPGFGQDANNKVILMGDYVEGLTPQAIKWSAWNTGALGRITKISVENFTLSYAGVEIYQLAICGGLTTILKLDIFATTADLGHASISSINQYITTAPISLGVVSTFLMLDFAPQGIGALVIKTYNIDKSITTTLRTFSIELANYHGQNLQRLFNVTIDKLMFYFQADQSLPGGLQGNFTFSELDVYVRKMWNMRPSLTQST